MIHSAKLRLFSPVLALSTVTLFSCGRSSSEQKAAPEGPKAAPHAVKPEPPAETIENLRWSRTVAENGETAVLQADAGAGFFNRTASFSIYKYDPNGAHSLLHRGAVPVASTQLRLEWVCDFHSPRKTQAEIAALGSGFENPKYFFTVTVGDREFGRETYASGFLKRRFAAGMLKLSQAHFLRQSAMMLPDKNFIDGKNKEERPGLEKIADILLYAHAHPDKKLLIGGHTGMKMALSTLRAEGVVALLENDKERWVDIVRKNHVFRDIQFQVLWSGFGTGVLDGLQGEQSLEAIRAFQSAEDLRETGAFGKAEWSAIFDRLQQKIAERVEQSLDGKAALAKRASLNWAYPENKAVRCSDLFPDEYATPDDPTSKPGRNIKVLFLDPEDTPKDICKRNSCKSYDCPVYYPVDDFNKATVRIGENGKFKLRLYLQTRDRRAMPAGSMYAVKYGDTVIGPRIMTETGVVTEEIDRIVDSLEAYWGSPKLLRSDEIPFKLNGVEYAYMQESTFVEPEAEDDEESVRRKADAILDNLSYKVDKETPNRVLTFQRDYCGVFTRAVYGEMCLKRTGELDDATVNALFETNLGGYEPNSDGCEACEIGTDTAPAQESDTVDSGQ